MDAQMRIWLEAEMSIWHRYLVNALSAPGYRRGGVAPEVARRFVESGTSRECLS